MENVFDDFAYKLSVRDCERFEQNFKDFMCSAVINEDEHQRILSRVMEKAGFETEENIVVKGTKKSRKRMIGIVIAAAVFATSAISAAAYYIANHGAWNALRYKFGGGNSVLSDEQTDVAEKTMERITTMDGECEINTFDELEITYEGAAADPDELELLFTIKRKDGSPFEEKEGYVWIVKYSEGLYANEKNDTLNKIYLDLSHCETNPDGSLSLALDGFVFYHSEYEKNDYRIGFVDLCYVPEEVCGVDGLVNTLGRKMWKSAYKLMGDRERIEADGEYIDVYTNKVTEEEYDSAYAEWQEKDKDYTEKLKEKSEYYYSGELVYRLPAVSLKNDVPVFTKEQTGSEFEVTISPQRITLAADGNMRKDMLRYQNKESGKVEIVVYKTDGSTELLEMDTFKEWLDHYTFEFIPQMPIKTEDITYIMLKDEKISINE